MKIQALAKGGPYTIFWNARKKVFVLLYRPQKARLYFLNSSIDLISGKSIANEGIEVLENRWQRRSVLGNEHPRSVTHLFYEYGIKSSGLPLAIEMEFAEESPIEFPSNTEPINLEYLNGPTFDLYQRQFNTVYQHLLNGDCYQVNLTNRFQYKIAPEVGAESLMARLWRDEISRAAFAHATYLPHLNTLYLSNSPECLFQRFGECFVTRPIKGTATISGDVLAAKRELLNSKKNQGELDMITDLLRNDFSSLGTPRSEVISRRNWLKVPGLLHQYSIIQKRIAGEVNWFTLLSSIFPGGSITGAPKKRVIEIIQSIETLPRGFYCGSTILSYKSGLSASINIRSSVVDLTKGNLLYGAGGGITLLSNLKEEWDETLSKVRSFTNLLT